MFFHPPRFFYSASTPCPSTPCPFPLTGPRRCLSQRSMWVPTPPARFQPRAVCQSPPPPQPRSGPIPLRVPEPPAPHLKKGSSSKHLPSPPNMAAATALCAPPAPHGPSSPPRPAPPADVTPLGRSYWPASREGRSFPPRARRRCRGNRGGVGGALLRGSGKFGENSGIIRGKFREIREFREFKELWELRESRLRCPSRSPGCAPRSWAE